MVPRMRPLATTLAALAVLAAGCGAGPDDPDDTGDAAQAARLPSGLLDRLREQYAVLRQEPAPPPRPDGDAAPERVPESVREALPVKALQVVRGEATFYADRFEGRRTASGIPFRQNQMVAAHRAFPFGTLLRVTNLRNDRSVTVRVVDRGPFGATAHARNTVLDLSRRAAERLGYIAAGRTPVRVEVLEWGDGVPRVS